MVGLNLALFGQHVMAHLARVRSMCAHSAIYWILFIWVCSAEMSYVSRVRLSVHAVVVHVLWDVSK